MTRPVEKPHSPHARLVLPALPVLETDEPEEDAGDMPRTVIITGAAGTIGQKLALAWRERYDLILLDRKPGEEIIEADLSVWDENWLGHFEEADAVVHLAAQSAPSAPWPELVEPNLDVLNNVFLATAGAGIERLIFASSNHVMGGYKHQGLPIEPDLPPQPDSPYGATKLMGESLGKALAVSDGLTFVAFRIGWVQPGPNLVETLPDEWSKGMWLSDDDLVDLFTRAVEAELRPGTHLILNAVSNNQGSRWPMAGTRASLDRAHSEPNHGAGSA